MKTNLRPHSPLARLITLVGVALALVLVLGACSSSSKSATSNADITIKDFAFTTKAVKAGATVTIHNGGSVTHTVTSDDKTSFNTSIDSGKDATFTAPSKAGSYKFHCNIHTQMTATLTVT